jgi:hypothetical protein
LVEKITETVTIFILSLLAPFIRPIINAVSAQLKSGSSSVVDASGKHQYEPWTDPFCTDPTHSLLSKDHFSNILNEPAGQVAAAILQYVAPRIIYAWEHPNVPVNQVLDDISRVFHHPALRDHHCELHRNMYDVVQRWAQSHRSTHIDEVLSSESVRKGKNHIGPDQEHSHGGSNKYKGSGSHSKVSGAPWEKLYQLKNSAGTSRDMLDDETAPPAEIPGAYSGAPSMFGDVHSSSAAPMGFANGPPPHTSPYPDDPSFSRQPYPSNVQHTSPYPDDPSLSHHPYPSTAPHHHPESSDSSAASWYPPYQQSQPADQYSYGTANLAQSGDYASYPASVPPSQGGFATPPPPPPPQPGYAYSHQQTEYEGDHLPRPPQQQPHGHYDHGEGGRHGYY